MIDLRLAHISFKFNNEATNILFYCSPLCKLSLCQVWTACKYQQQGNYSATMLVTCVQNYFSLNVV